jgi:hypothetical protein
VSTPNPFGALPTASQLGNPGFAAFVSWKLGFQVTPIILTNGIATNLGGALPIVALTEGLNAITSLFSANANAQADGFFANYKPLPGASLVNNQVAMYPFANQSVAANAIIAQPLTISMLMVNPAGGQTGGYPLKTVTMVSLQNALAQHNNSGGTYTIITPAFIYTNCIMTGFRCVDSGESLQVQYAWQIDFVQPLVTIQSAQIALSGLMQKLTNGTTISGTPSWSIAGLAVNNPTNLLTSSLVPSTSIQ